MSETKTDPEPEPKLRPVRVGLIGPGSVADDWLIPALKRVPGATFWSVLARDEAKARAFASKHSAQAATPACSDIAVFLGDPDLDAVIIATPDNLHAAQTIAAAEAGKHVFVEKPMASRLEDAREMVDACSAANVKLAVGYHLRFHAGHRQLSKLIAEGKLGSLQHVKLCWTWKAPENNWRAKNDRWFSLSATGTHCLDLARWLITPSCGPIVSVRSLSDSANGAPDGTSVVIVKFESGATAEVVSSVVFKAPRMLSIYGSEGSAICTDTLGARGAGTILLNGTALEFPVVDPYQAELADFIEAARGDSVPFVDGLAGQDNVALLESASNNWSAISQGANHDEC